MVLLEREYCQRNFWNAEKEKLLSGPTLVRVNHTNPAEENRKYCAICSPFENAIGMPELIVDTSISIYIDTSVEISTFLSQQVMTLDKTKRMAAAMTYLSVSPGHMLWRSRQNSEII